jgi:hypothetical protein
MLLYLAMPHFRKKEAELMPHFDKCLYVPKHLRELQDKPVLYLSPDS